MTIEPGEHVAVIGPSGAGKTTLLQLLGAALKPSVGNVTLDGQSVWTLSTRGLQQQRGRLFYAPQTPPLPPRQRVIVSLLAAKLPALSLWQSLKNLLYPQHVEEVAGAFARGVTLVTTLHQVKVATAEFPRVLGLREGKLVFDLPGHAVSEDILAELYAQFEYELALVEAPVAPQEQLPPAKQEVRVGCA